MRSKAVETVIGILEKEPDVLALFLFGSHARGEHTNVSDYDFYVVLDNNTKDSLREDGLYKNVFDATRQLQVDIHLTFQYLFVLDEDKSLLLKISSEGELLFSKAFLIGSYKQAGLQKYYLCSWNINEKRILTNKREGIKTSWQLIGRLLRGYVQKYPGGKYKKQGMIDNVGIIGIQEGMPAQILVMDSMLEHVQAAIERYHGKLQILHEIYIPREKLGDLERYKIKKKLEIMLLSKDKKQGFIRSFWSADAKSVHIRYISGVQLRHTTLNKKDIPPEVIEFLKQKIQGKKRIEYEFE